MKVRLDFVTNSSSSSYICLKLSDKLTNKILSANNLPKNEDKLSDLWEENGCDDFNLKGDLTLVLTEGYIFYIGYDLSEHELENKTLNQLKEEMVKTFNKNYDFKITTKDVEFDYGEVER